MAVHNTAGAGYLLNGITAAGTTQGSATGLTAAISVVTTCPAGAGVILSQPPEVVESVVLNRSGADLLVYPIDGAQIETGAANAPVTVPASNDATFTRVSPTQWRVTQASTTIVGPVEIFGSPVSAGSLPTLPIGSVLALSSPDGTRTIEIAYTFGGGLSNTYSGFVGARAAGTKAAPTALLSGSYVAGFMGVGYDGTAWSGVTNGAAAQWVFGASENWAVGSHGTQAILLLTPNGTASVTTVFQAFGTFANFLVPISVGGSSLDGSAVLDVQSSTQGFLPPRVTTTQKNAITSPAEGLVVYDVTLHALCVYNGTAWKTVTAT